MRLEPTPEEMSCDPRDLVRFDMPIFKVGDHVYNATLKRPGIIIGTHAVGQHVYRVCFQCPDVGIVDNVFATTLQELPAESELLSSAFVSQCAAKKNGDFVKTVEDVLWRIVGDELAVNTSTGRVERLSSVGLAKVSQGSLNEAEKGQRERFFKHDADIVFYNAQTKQFAFTTGEEVATSGQSFARVFVDGNGQRLQWSPFEVEWRDKDVFEQLRDADKAFRDARLKKVSGVLKAKKFVLGVIQTKRARWEARRVAAAADAADAADADDFALDDPSLYNLNKIRTHISEDGVPPKAFFDKSDDLNTAEDTRAGYMLVSAYRLSKRYKGDLFKAEWERERYGSSLASLPSGDEARQWSYKTALDYAKNGKVVDVSGLWALMLIPLACWKNYHTAIYARHAR